LKEKGEQVIDLEHLAQHQGSSYGTLGYLIQPTQEQFENDLAHELSLLDPASRVWIEDESLTIGKRMIPKALWLQMRQAPLFRLDVPINQRIEVLAREYGVLNKEFLIECTERIGRRLGPEQTRDSITAIREGRISDFVRKVLVYYDKTYTTGQSRRESIIYTIECTAADTEKNTAAVLQTTKDLEYTNG
ncbi:MAG TPA: tRNA 2-selenouridine(34) synthase MnmH, partial [Sphingobacteriaceae bacterium]